MKTQEQSKNWLRMINWLKESKLRLISKLKNPNFNSREWPERNKSRCKDTKMTSWFKLSRLKRTKHFRRWNKISKSKVQQNHSNLTNFIMREHWRNMKSTPSQESTKNNPSEEWQSTSSQATIKNPSHQCCQPLVSASLKPEPNDSPPY